MAAIEEENPGFQTDIPPQEIVNLVVVALMSLQPGKPPRRR